MIYTLTADAIVILHLSYVIFVVAGGTLVFRWSWIALLHLPALAWGVLLELNGWLCPLTPLELRLREASGESGYNSGFIEHYILPVLYPDELDRTMQIVIGCFVLAINIAIYGRLLWRIRRRS